MVLRPPVEPMLAQARETVPGPGVLPGGLAFEAKFDGYRCLLFTPIRQGGPTLLQSRRGSLIQRHFPDLVSAAAHLPSGLVLDGELVVWHQGRFSFEALQRRAVSGGRTVEQLAVTYPAHYIAFDILQAGGQAGGEELLNEPYEHRRAILEALYADHGLTAPWTLCPMTTDPDKAREWLEDWTDVSGAEGLVVKAMNQRYRPWTGAKFTSAWGTRDVLDTTLVQPDVVAEISADTSIDRGGVYRHPIWYVRLRLDATVDDVPRFGGGRQQPRDDRG